MEKKEIDFSKVSLNVLMGAIQAEFISASEQDRDGRWVIPLGAPLTEALEGVERILAEVVVRKE